MGAFRRARRRQRRRRLLAVLAAGSVLGVGSLSTIAAWTDTEVATGGFTASVFDTQSAPGGSTAWASHPAGNPLTLTFTTPSGLSPTVSSFSAMKVRTSPTTNVAGSVVLTSAGGTGALTTGLEYRMVRMTSSTATCDATAFTTGTPVFVAGSAGGYVALTTSAVAPSVPAAPVSNPIAAAGAEIGFCVDVRIVTGAANAFQGTSSTVTWTFTATSAS